MYGTLITIVSNDEVVRFDYTVTEQKILENARIPFDDSNYIQISCFPKERCFMMNNLISSLYDTNTEVMKENILTQINNLLKTEQYK